LTGRPQTTHDAHVDVLAHWTVPHFKKILIMSYINDIIVYLLDLIII